MFAAIGLFLTGLLTGKLLARLPLASLMARMVFPAILCLLFLLGAEIGANAELFNNLPIFGVHALVLALLTVSGSMLVAHALERWLHNRGRNAR